MKLKNHTIIMYLNTLQKCADMNLPAKLRFAIAKNMATLSNDYKIYAEELTKLYNKFGEKDDDGNLVQNENNPIPNIKNEHKDIFGKEIADLLNIEVDIDIHHVEESDLFFDDERYDIITPNNIVGLLDILCEKKS